MRNFFNLLVLLFARTNDKEKYMKINFANQPVNYSATVTQKANPSFKGIDNKNHNINDLNNEKFNLGFYNNREFQKIVVPEFQLRLQLIKDGFSIEQISKHKLFAINGEKTSADHKAMERVYASLKTKFKTPDIDFGIEQEHQLEQEIASVFGKQPRSKDEICKDKILTILHYTTQKTESVILDLLNDENFDNYYITQPLVAFGTFGDPEYMSKTLELAQQIGYPKEFSQALSVIIGEANEQNFPMVQKMLTEQEFLINNPDFVADKMMRFLREPDDSLALDYAKIPKVTLATVDMLRGNIPDEEE